MATDAVIDFLYSDGEPMFSAYVSSSTHIEEFPKSIIDAFIEADDDRQSERLNWDYLATKAFSLLATSHDSTFRILPPATQTFGSFIYHYVIRPDADIYRSKANHINYALHMKVMYGGQAEPFVEGYLTTIQYNIRQYKASLD